MWLGGFREERGQQTWDEYLLCPFGGNASNPPEMAVEGAEPQDAGWAGFKTSICIKMLLLLLLRKSIFSSYSLGV